MKGYLGKPEETAKVITEDGWFRTGDIGKVDEGGYVYVEDRLKDMIISGGENIYSPEVERVMSEHPAVAEVAVIGVPDDRWGEVVKAVVGLKPDTEATEEELIAFTAERLAKFKCPARSTSCRRCPATRRARSSRRTCASPTGPTATALSSDPPGHQTRGSAMPARAGPAPPRRPAPTAAGAARAPRCAAARTRWPCPRRTVRR